MTKKHLLNKIDPVKSNIGISGVKTCRNGSQISCNNTEDSNKMKTLITAVLTEYKVRQLKQLNPRIRIPGIDKDIAKESVVEYSVTLNGSLFCSTYVCNLKKFLPL